MALTFSRVLGSSLLSIFIHPFLFASDFETITLGKDFYQKIKDSPYSQKIKLISSTKSYAQIQVPSEILPDLSEKAHSWFGRCGGFMLEDQKNVLPLSADVQHQFRAKDHPIKNQSVVKPMLDKVSEENIRNEILRLSAYRNRFCNSDYGKNSQEEIARRWREMTAHRQDVTIELVKHSSYIQPSVVLTIKGKTRPEEYVVVGGHGDSINGYSNHREMLAPGADDNASGIASVTEVLRIINEENYIPDRSLVFISYAAEEIGLKGSQDVARRFSQQQKNVVGVMQFDMTNYDRSGVDLVLIEDHTNQDLTKWSADLIREYLPTLNWHYDSCGYACSDHASWTRAGYPSVFPTETSMNAYNPQIHTRRDTISESNDHAEHAVNFAKLGVAFSMELSSL